MTSTTSAYMFIQDSHIDISSSMWQTQLPLVWSSNCQMFPVHPQPPMTNTTSAYMFTQVSHASITSPDPCDKHNFRIYIHPSVTCFHYIPASCNKYNFRLYVHPSVTCFHYIPSSLWQTQLPPISSPKCHMLIYMLCWISSWYCQYYSWNTVHDKFSSEQHTCNLLFTMEHISRGFRRNALAAHPSPLKVGKYMLYSIQFKIWNQKNNNNCNSSNLWNF